MYIYIYIYICIIYIYIYTYDFPSKPLYLYNYMGLIVFVVVIAFGGAIAFNGFVWFRSSYMTNTCTYKDRFTGTTWQTRWSAACSIHCHHRPQRKNLYRCLTMTWSIFRLHVCPSSSAAASSSSVRGARCWTWTAWGNCFHQHHRSRGASQLSPLQYLLATRWRLDPLQHPLCWRYSLWCGHQNDES